MASKQDKPSITQRLLSVFGYEKKDLTLDQLFDVNTNPFNGKRSRLTNQREQLKAYVDWVYAAASAIAQDAATIDLKAFANRSGKPNGKIANQLVYHPKELRALRKQLIAGKRALEELDDYILLDLFDKPNPVQDGDTFKEMLFLNMLLAGEFFAWKRKNGMGRTFELWPMMPYAMKETIGADRLVSKWTYRVGAEDIDFTPDEVFHVKLTDPDNMYRGSGVVKAAARAINTGGAASDWNESFFANSARPDLALETESTLTPEIIDRLKSEWSDRYKGVDNAHKVAVLEAGLKLNKINPTQKEMDFLESLKFNRDQQLAMFKTSRTMLGIVEGDGRSNMEAAEYNQAKRVIRPLDRRLVSAINQQLAPDFDPKLVIGFTDPVPDDKEFELKQKTESINSYRTVNEVREEEGLEPLEGGDLLYISSLLVPLGTVPATEPTDPSEDPVDLPDPAAEGKKGLPKPRASTTAKKSATS